MVPTGLSAINSRPRKNDGRGKKKRNCCDVNAADQAGPWQPVIRLQGFSGDGGPAGISCSTHESSAEKTNKLKLRPPPPPLTSLYTPPKKSNSRSKESNKKSYCYLSGVSYSDLRIRKVEGAVKVSGGRFRKGVPPPLNQQQKLEQEQPSRRFLLEPSGSRKRVPVSPGFTTTGLSTNHLDRRI